MRFIHGVQSDISPSEIAKLTFNPIRGERFYIITQTEVKDDYRARLEQILDEL